MAAATATRPPHSSTIAWTRRAMVRMRVRECTQSGPSIRVYAVVAAEIGGRGRNGQNRQRTWLNQWRRQRIQRGKKRRPPRGSSDGECGSSAQQAGDRCWRQRSCHWPRWHSWHSLLLARQTAERISCMGSRKRCGGRFDRSGAGRRSQHSRLDRSRFHSRALAVAATLALFQQSVFALVWLAFLHAQRTGSSARTFRLCDTDKRSLVIESDALPQRSELAFVT